MSKNNERTHYRNAVEGYNDTVPYKPGSKSFLAGKSVQHRIHSQHESRYEHERHGNPKNPDDVSIFRTIGYSGPHFGLIHIGGLPPFVNPFKRKRVKHGRRISKRS